MLTDSDSPPVARAVTSKGPRINWPDVLPEDATEVSQALLKELEANIISKEDLVEYCSQW